MPRSDPVAGRSRSSRRKPCSAATDPGESDTVFVAFARIGSRPSQTSIGNVISEPPPAIELMAPATVDAASRMAASVGVTIARLGEASFRVRGMYRRRPGSVNSARICHASPVFHLDRPEDRPVCPE